MHAQKNKTLKAVENHIIKKISMKVNYIPSPFKQYIQKKSLCTATIQYTSLLSKLR